MTTMMARMLKLVKAHGCTNVVSERPNVMRLTSANDKLYASLNDNGAFTIAWCCDHATGTITSYGETALCIALCRAYAALEAPSSSPYEALGK